MTEARAAMDRRDFGRAAGLLRDVLARDPENLEAHYRLGISASHLDLTDETRREFEWVVAHGAPDAVEVREARAWLAGLAARGAAPTAEEHSGTESAGAVQGRVVWDDGGGPTPLGRQQLFLKGLPQSPTSEEYRVLRTAADGSYQFADVVPGPYMLTDRIAGAPRWQLRVVVPAGQTLQLDLGPANSLPQRNDFPS